MYVYGAVSENLFVPAMDTLRAVIFRARQLFLCCPVNGGLTYRLPSIKFVPPGNFGVSGVQPQINSINYLNKVRLLEEMGANPL